MTASRTVVGILAMAMMMATLGTATRVPYLNDYTTLVPSIAVTRNVLGSLRDLATALIINPLRLLTGSVIDTIPDAVEQFFGLPVVSFASQRVRDVTVDLTQLQLFGEEVLGIEEICKPADFRAGSRQPAAVEGPTLIVTFNSVNCSVDDNTSFGYSKLNKTIHINTTFACDKKLIEYEKFHRAERYRCAECRVEKQFGEELEFVLFDGGKSQVFDSIASFLNATSLGQVLPFADTFSSLRLNSQLEQLLAGPRNAALLTSVVELQQRISAVGDSLLTGYDSKVNAPLDKVLNAALAANVWAITGIFDLLK